MKFDIILPTLNRDTLCRAVESVLSQSYKDWELQIIADNVRIDWKTLPEDRADRIVLHDHYTLPNEVDFGAGARNAGISWSENNWIAYIDDDDIWYPNHLSTILELAQENPQADLFKTAAQRITTRHDRLVRDRIRKREINTEDPMTITLAHSRELFERTSGWQPHDNHDHTLFKEMIEAGGVLASTEKHTVMYQR